MKNLLLLMVLFFSGQAASQNLFILEEINRLRHTSAQQTAEVFQKKGWILMNEKQGGYAKEHPRQRFVLPTVKDADQIEAVIEVLHQPKAGNRVDLVFFAKMFQNYFHTAVEYEDGVSRVVKTDEVEVFKVKDYVYFFEEPVLKSSTGDSFKSYIVRVWPVADYEAL